MIDKKLLLFEEVYEKLLFTLFPFSPFLLLINVENFKLNGLSWSNETEGAEIKYLLNYFNKIDSSCEHSVSDNFSPGRIPIIFIFF